MRTALRTPAFRRLLTASSVSLAGDFVYTVALVAVIFDRTRSATWVGAAATVRFLPPAIVGAAGGVIAGRFDRRRLMTALDAFRGLLMIGLAVGTVAEAPPWTLLVISGIVSTVSAPYRAASVAITPDVVSESDLAGANALEAILGQLSFFIGPAIGAALYSWSSAPVCFVVNAVTFFVAAVLVAGLPVARRAAPSPADEPDGDRRAGWAAELAGSVRRARQMRGVVPLVVISAGVLFAYGFELVCHALIAEERLGLGPQGAGYLLGATGVGGVIAGPLAGRLGGGTRIGVALVGSGIAMGTPLMLLSIVPNQWVAYALLLVEGAGVMVFEVCAMTLLQRLVQGDDLARVFGLSDAANAFAGFLGTVAAPALVRGVGLEWSVVVGGGVLVVLSVVSIGSFRAVDLENEERVLRLRPVVEALRSLGLFEGAPTGALERVAAGLTTQSSPAGAVILREGDPPDDLYVVRTGTLGVSTLHRDLRSFPPIGEGDWFGEVGLIHRIPRTATVTATTDVELWRIPGSLFLEAVDLEADTAQVVQRRATIRLRRTHPELASA